MGTKSNPAEFDCYANALPDEPMFVLLARDPHAPALVRLWAALRKTDIAAGIRPSSDRPMVAEAFACASDMAEWRLDNDGKWRNPPPRKVRLERWAEIVDRVVVAYHHEPIAAGEGRIVVPFVLEYEESAS